MEQPPSLHTIKDALSQFYENLKAEVIVLDLLENKRISPNDFSVIHESTFSRGYRRDLTRVKINPEDKLEIYVSRNGIYDALPESIFHEAVAINSPDSYREIRRKKKKEEADARLLFAPLEHELFMQKVRILQKEKEIISEFNRVDASFLIDFWGVKDRVPQCYLNAFIKALPLAHKISQNKNLIANCLSEILKEKVYITQTFLPFKDPLENEEKNNSSQKIIPNSDLETNYILGVNTTLNCEKSVLKYPFFDINIELSTIDQKKKFEKNGVATKLIQVFCDYFIPLEVEWNVTLHYTSSIDNFKLNHESTYLGLSTTL